MISVSLNGAPAAPSLQLGCKLMSRSNSTEMAVGVTNSSEADVNLMMYPQRIEMLDRPLLTLRCGTEELPYIGRFVRRTPWGRDEFVPLLPQQSRHFVIVLDANYDLPQNLTNCTVTLNTHIWNTEEDRAEAVQLSTPLAVSR